MYGAFPLQTPPIPLPSSSSSNERRSGQSPHPMVLGQDQRWEVPKLQSINSKNSHENRFSSFPST